MIGLLLGLIVASNADGKTLVRVQQGRLVPAAVASGPLIANDSGTVCHATWNGASIQDVLGCSWTMNGTVPQIARDGKTPAGAGTYTAANYYSLGTGSDVMDFAGDFSACVVVKCAVAPTSSNAVLSDGQTATAGWWFDVGFTSKFNFVTSQSGSNAALATTNAPVAGVNVVCGGRSGTTQYVKGNLGAINSGTSATITAASSAAAMIGRLAGATNIPSTGCSVLEAWVSTTAPSDGLFTAIQQRAKTRGAITAW